MTTGSQYIQGQSNGPPSLEDSIKANVAESNGEMVAADLKEERYGDSKVVVRGKKGRKIKGKKGGGVVSEEATPGQPKSAEPIGSTPVVAVEEHMAEVEATVPPPGKRGRRRKKKTASSAEMSTFPVKPHAPAVIPPTPEELLKALMWAGQYFLEKIGETSYTMRQLVEGLEPQYIGNPDGLLGKTRQIVESLRRKALGKLHSLAGDGGGSPTCAEASGKEVLVDTGRHHKVQQQPIVDGYDTSGDHVGSEVSQTSLEAQTASLSLNEKRYSVKLETFHSLMKEAVIHRWNGELTRAIASCRSAIVGYPSCPDAHCYLASLLSQTGATKAVVKCLQAALKLCPNHSAALVELAKVRLAERNFVEAERLCRHVLETSTDSSTNPAYNLMGKIMLQKGDMTGLNEFLKQYPSDSDDTEEVYVVSKQVCCDWDDYANRMKKLSDLIDRKLRENQPPPINAQLANQLAYQLTLQQRVGIAAHYANRPVIPAAPITHRLVGDGKRLRVGYVCTGPTGFPLDFNWETFGFGTENPHRPSRAEIFAYFLDGFEAISCATNEHIVSLQGFGKNFNAIANRIASDDIQILVNMDGLLSHWREMNEIFARRPAPIQVVHRYTMGTTGAPYVDYMITDKVVSPLEFAHGYSEKLAYLPNGVWVGTKDHLQLEQSENFKQKCSLRRRFGLPQFPFMFGVSGEPWRIDPGTFKCWCEILRRVPGSFLWMIGSYNQEAQSNLQKEAERHGVNESRLVFAPFPSSTESIRLDYLVDVVLDTPMCNGIRLMTFIAAAIPVLTLPMETFTSRLTASMLTSTDCEELIAKSMPWYVEAAVNLGNKPELLKEMKTKMIDVLPDSNLFKIDQYFADLENLYDKMWKRRELGEKPDHIELEDGERFMSI